MLHQIGSGVLGPVFRCSDPRHDRLVVAKTFKLDLVPEDVARLAEALRRLVSSSPSHPHLVRLMDAGLEGMTPYLVLADAPGDTLDVVLRRSAPMTPADAWPIVRGLAEAVDAAWAAGLGHGALHPRDVLVHPSTGQPCVTGAGLAQALESVGVRAPIRRPYAAPERAAGAPPALASDIYAVGAIAHELVTGRRPAGPGEQDGAFLRQMSAEQRTALRAALASALAVDPDRRPPSAGALADALELAASGGQMALPMSAPPLPAAEDLPPAVEPTRLAASVVPPVSPRAAEATLPPRESATPVVSVEMAGLAFHHETRGSGRAPGWKMPAVLATGLAIGGLLTFVLWTSPRPLAPPVAEIALAPAPGDTEVAVHEPPADRPAPTAAEATSPPAARVAAEVGRMIVRSVPSGAMLTVDGELAGQTPATLRGLTLGAHLVQIARPGYAPRVETVTLSRSRPEQTLTVTLEAGFDRPQPARGSVFFDSRPRGARVWVDGRLVGTTPLQVPSLSVGRHAVRMETDGYRAVSTEIEVRAGEPSRLAVTLERTTGLGR